MLRVTSGSARGCRLNLVPGSGTRPIMDRVKQALFNILGTAIRDSVFLDVFAGTGSVGIEALSRGAKQCTFLDSSPAAISTIHKNLVHTRLADAAQVWRVDALAFLRQTPTIRYDFIFVAPPQYQNIWLNTLQQLDAQPQWLAEHGSLIVQIDPKERSVCQLRHFTPVDEHRYGNTLLWFFEFLS